MQSRIVDRGNVYDFSVWRSIFGGLISPGVYKGFDLSASGSNLIIGVDHTQSVPGMLMLNSGIGVIETSPITLPVPSVGSYTVKVRHTDNGLVGGTNATYYISSGIDINQPTDGVILGWIRNVGGLFSDYMLTTIYKLNADSVSKTSASRIPQIFNPPTNIIWDSFSAGVTYVSGWDSEARLSWIGLSQSSGLSSSIVGRLQWKVGSKPYQISIKSIIPVGNQILVNVYDTNLSHIIPILTTTITAHSSWSWSYLINTSSNQGDWTIDSNGTIELTFVMGTGTTTKVSSIEINNWPFGLPRI